jgi:hypothetical protein
MALAVCLASPASAQGISAFWQPVPITPQAIADDPQLATMQTWDLMVTTSGNWASAGLRGYFEPITSAHWYHHALAGHTRPAPALVAQHPAAAFDTYVTAPADNGVTGAPAILGDYFAGPVPYWGDTGGHFSVGWGDAVIDPPGTYAIVRWTFPRGMMPTVFNPPTLPRTSLVSQTNPDAHSIIPQIPEPSIVGLLGVCGLVLRRRTAHSRSGTDAKLYPD